MSKKIKEFFLRNEKIKEIMMIFYRKHRNKGNHHTSKLITYNFLTYSALKNY